MIIFISGGCKNGKSTIAEGYAKKLAQGGPLYYIATMIPKDEEDLERITRHRQSREGAGFETLEWGSDLNNFLDSLDASGTYLLDSVTALLSNEMFPYSNGEFGFDAAAGNRVSGDLSALSTRVKNIVFVSDFMYLDPKSDEYSEKYMEALALCDRTLARLSDKVIEVSAGIEIVYKEK